MSTIGSRAVIVTIELPRMTCCIFFFVNARGKDKKDEFSSRYEVRGRGTSESSSHHHADVLLHLVVNGAVEHNVHKLVEAAEGARDGTVGVEGD